MDRPPAVTAVAILLLIFSISAFAQVIFDLSFGTRLLAAQESFLLITGILQLVSGVGLLMFKAWSRILTIILSVIIIGFAFVNFFILNIISFVSIFGLLFQLVLYGLIIWYLIKRWKQ